MKAISPSMPATRPLRSDRGSEASAADEAFGAMIAAALGATARPVVTSAPQPKPAATPSVSSVTSSSSVTGGKAAGEIGPRDTSARDTSVRKNGKADGDQPVAPGTDQAATTASGATPQTSTPAPPAAVAAPTVVPAGPIVVPAVAMDEPVVGSGLPGVTAVAAKPASAPGVANAAPLAVPAGLENAATALAQALTADAPAKPVDPAGAPESQPVSTPAFALAQGQLPAQLVKLPTVSGPSAESAQHTADAAGDVGAADAADAVDAAATSPSPAVAAAAATAPQVATPPVVNAAAAAQLRPDTTPGGPAGQRDAHEASGDDQHSTSATPATAPAASDSKATPAPTSLDPTLQPSSVANVAVPAPVQQPVATAISQAAQAVVAPPAEQIVQVVAPLHTAKDGDYTLSLQLHPAELGPVTVRVDVHQGVLSVHMVADNAQGHEALNQSLNDLRSQLEAGGVRTGDIDLGSRSSLSGENHGQQQDAYRQPNDTPADRDASTGRRPADTHRDRATVSNNDAALDVRI